MLSTKDLDNKVFDYIDPWGETLAYIAWAIRYSYHHTIMFIPGQAVFGRYTLFSLTPFIEWKVVTTVKKQQVDIDNVQENARRVTYDHAICDQFYVEMTGIYRKLDYKKKNIELQKSLQKVKFESNGDK